MRTIDFTARFRKDFKRIGAGPHRRTIGADLAAIVDILASDQPLDRRFADHPLVGAWASYRDCHIHPDLVLIYKKVGDDVLVLARLGSHSDLSL